VTGFSSRGQKPHWGFFLFLLAFCGAVRGTVIRPTVPKICYRLGAPTNFDRSAVLIAPFICHWQRLQTNRFKSCLLKIEKRMA
jgi:hypothetical protein